MMNLELYPSHDLPQQGLPFNASSRAGHWIVETFPTVPALLVADRSMAVSKFQGRPASQATRARGGKTAGLVILSSDYTV